MDRLSDEAGQARHDTPFEVAPALNIRRRRQQQKAQALTCCDQRLNENRAEFTHAKLLRQFMDLSCAARGGQQLGSVFLLKCQPEGRMVRMPERQDTDPGIADINEQLVIEISSR